MSLINKTSQPLLQFLCERCVSAWVKQIWGLTSYCTILGVVKVKFEKVDIELMSDFSSSSPGKCECFAIPLLSNETIHVRAKLSTSKLFLSCNVSAQQVDLHQND